jgi:hypothetical protein
MVPLEEAVHAIETAERFIACVSGPPRIALLSRPGDRTPPGLSGSGLSA